MTNKFIPYGRQDIDDEDINNVVKVLKSDFITQGPTVPLFENLLSDYCRAKYVFCVNSATSALHLACLSLGLKKDDLVWTSPISFVASANCALYCGAKVDFIDIDPFSYNISVKKLEEKQITIFHLIGWILDQLMELIQLKQLSEVLKTWTRQQKKFIS